MRHPTWFLVPLFGLLTFASESHTQTRNKSIQKRQLMTCDQTYGAGSVICGGAGSPFCYNPGAGQSCCASDSGYCDKGFYCAPVAGYCCVEGEDVANCAKNAHFTLPATLASSDSATVPVSTAGVTVDPFLPSWAGVSSTTDIPSTRTTETYSSDIGISTRPIETRPTQISNTTAPPSVQVSLAFKRDGFLRKSTAAMAVTGVFAAIMWF